MSTPDGKGKKPFQWLLHQMVDYLGFLTLLVFNPIIMLFGDLRVIVYHLSLRRETWEKYFERLIKYLLLVFYIEIALLTIHLADNYLEATRIIDGIMLAALVIVFFGLQLPHMLPPYFAVTFATLDRWNKRKYTSTKPGIETYLRFNITNLGLTVYKNCMITVLFEDGFKVIETTGYEVSDQFRRANFIPNMPILRSKLNSLIPFTNYTTMSQNSSLLIHVNVTIPSTYGLYKITVLMVSESTWGSAKQTLTIEVSPSDLPPNN